MGNSDYYSGQAVYFTPFFFSLKPTTEKTLKREKRVLDSSQSIG
jgi:hypothetical protein